MSSSEAKLQPATEHAEPTKTVTADEHAHAQATGNGGSGASDVQCLEYAELASNLRSGVSVLWDAFKTYFAVISLMFAACGFLLSTQSPLDAGTSAKGIVIIAVAGILITILGGLGVKRAVAYQRLFIARGVCLDRTLGSELFAKAHEAFHGARVGSDGLTYIVFTFFGLGWLALLLFYWSCAFGSGHCPAPVCKPDEQALHGFTPAAALAHGEALVAQPRVAELETMIAKSKEIAQKH